MRAVSLPPPDADASPVDLTPMLDVVFILLIFFIVTASFVRETGLGLNRAASPLGVPESAAGVVLAVDADDRYWLEGREIAPGALRANLLRLEVASPDLQLVVSADPGSSAQALVRVLDAARAAEIADVAVADGSPPR